MVACGVLSQSEAKDAIRWEIYLTIASAFGIGTALVNSGIAASVAEFLVKVGHLIGFGDAGILGAVYMSTVLISQVVANNAAAALIFPIAMDAAELVEIDRSLMSYTLMLAASAAFMTPFGYQTNVSYVCVCVCLCLPVCACFTIHNLLISSDMFFLKINISLHFSAHGVGAWRVYNDGLSEVRDTYANRFDVR